MIRTYSLIALLHGTVNYSLSCIFVPNAWYFIKDINILDHWFLYEIVVPIVNCIGIPLIINLIIQIKNVFDKFINKFINKFSRKEGDDYMSRKINKKQNKKNQLTKNEKQNIYDETILSPEELQTLLSSENLDIKKCEKELNDLMNLKEKFLKEINHPKQIKQVLDKYIIGQEKAKRIVSQVVFNHIKINRDNLKLPEQNILLIGPSGCGKTEIFRVLKEELDLNIHILDISTISFSGYSAAGGNHLKDFLKDVRSGDIVVFDEFDKILLKNNNIRRDGDMLQSEFLKLLEGEKGNLRNCLFIFAGAFYSKTFMDMLETENKSMGFLQEALIIDNNENDLVGKLKNFGIMNELLGRFSFIIELNGLDKKDFLKILKNEKSLYFKYKEQFFKEYNVEITINDDLLISLAEEAVKDGLGVRGINSKIINCFNEVLYSLDDTFKHKKIILNKNNLREFGYLEF